MARHRIRKRPMSQINVVPYIDVMLVLLVIFMITTPMLGVSVDLPEAPSAEMESSEAEPPLMVSVDVDGQYFLNRGPEPDQPIDAETLAARVTAVLRQKPKTRVMVKGDRNVPYGRVVAAMAVAQAAGADSVGLVTRNPEKAE